MSDLTTISYGAGTQSSVMMLMAARGDITPMPDAAIWADTGNEPEAVYDMVTWMQGQVPFPLIAVSARRPIIKALAEGTNVYGNPIGSPLPMHTLDASGHKGMNARMCTSSWKLRPITSVLRNLLGVDPGRRVPAGTEVESWLGISLDEVQRMKPSQDRWKQNRWPLIEVRMSRHDCLRWWQENSPANAPPLPRSACVICPYRSTREWLNVARTDPIKVIEAVLAEASYQGTQRARGIEIGQFLHPRRIPLQQAIAADYEGAEAQPSMFDAECEGMCGV